MSIVRPSAVIVSNGFPRVDTRERMTKQKEQHVFRFFVVVDANRFGHCGPMTFSGSFS